MSTSLRRTLFFLFFVSGFCGLLYQVIWLRLAFASFGIVTPVLSLLISTFMLGLAIGSWGGGLLIARLTARTGLSAILYYGLAEFIIGIGAFAVPWLFVVGEEALLPIGGMDSAYYLSYSAAIIAMSILPFSICMGTTFPLMMAFVRERHPEQSTSFSFLYLANVIGAMCGTLATPLLFVELFGFNRTLLIGACGNLLVAAMSVRLARQVGWEAVLQPVEKEVKPQATSETSWMDRSLIPLILLTTGFVAMALEVVWTRAFTPVLKTQVYSFASLLFTYLLATWIGSYLYRRHLDGERVLKTADLLRYLALVAFAQIVVDDPRLQATVWGVLLSIVPFCGLLGYLTPKLIDEYSSGMPRSAGHAYALNVVGSIIGPLFASYILLPAVGVKWSTVILAVPILILSFAARRGLVSEMKKLWPTLAATGVAAAIACIYSTSYEELYESRGAVVRRDHTATVISHITPEGAKGMLVNGKEITGTTPTTKIMAHMPLSFLKKKPESALVICFGMGTTYRSLLTWDIDATAVELVPSVRDAFDYYFDDAADVLKNSRGRIVIDDGRRFLKRTDEKFDVITLDPPPPPEAAGSSLLYSEEFYELVKQRLTDDGILQQWFPGGELSTFQAIVRSLLKSFPHVKAFRAHDDWGIHFLASRQPIEIPSVETMIERMPADAQQDLLEWSSGRSLQTMVETILAEERQLPVERMVDRNSDISITDDRPFNEYYLLRRMWQYFTGNYTIVL